MGERAREHRWTTLLLVAGFLAPMALGIGPFGLGLLGSAQAASTPNILKVGFIQRVDSLNPFRGITDASQVFYGLVYDYLYGVGQDQESVPNLADGYEILSGGTIWRYHLNKTAKWHDGTDFTADDVVETVNKNIAVSGQLWAFWPYLKNVQSVARIDADTVDLNFYTPVVFGTSLMFPILQKAQIQGMSPVTLQNTWENLDPIGTGPFKTKPGAYWDWYYGLPLKLIRNPAYHFPPLRPENTLLDEIWLITYGSEQTMATALENDDIQVATFSVATLQGLKGKPNIATAEWLKATQTWVEVGINMDPGARTATAARLDHPVRRAMSLATNKSFILEQYYSGKGALGATLISPVTPKWHYEPTAAEKAYMEWTAPTTVQALQKANDTLSAAGYTNWDGSSTSPRIGAAGSNYTNKALSFRMVWRMEYPAEGLVAQFLKAQWAKIGIQITVEGVTEDVLESEVYGEKTDLYIWYWSGDPDPNYLLFIETTYAAYGGWNDNYYSDPLYDAAYDATMGEVNEALRIQKVFDAQRIHYLSGSYIIFVYPYGEWAWNTKSWGGWIDPVAHPGASIEAFWTANPLWRSVYPLLTGAPTLDALVPLAGTINVPVNLTVRATDPEGGALDYTIDWGDGTASTTVVDQPNGTSVAVNHTYTTTGTFTYTVNVTDPDGKSDEKFNTATIVTDWGPENLGIQPSTLTPATNVSVTFQGLATDRNGDPLRFTWDFGDSSPLSVGNPASHSYRSTGVYIVTMHVSDGDWKDPLIHNVSTVVVLTVIRNDPPLLATLTAKVVNQGEAVYFEAYAVDPDGDPLVYHWTFSDGTGWFTRTVSNITHAYIVPPGVYDYTVAVTDIAGHNVSMSSTVTVLEPDFAPPVASASANPNPIDDGGTVVFSGEFSTDDVGVVNWTWSFTEKGTPRVLYGVIASWRFTEPGIWNITLTVCDASGKTGMDWIEIVVRDTTVPVASAVAAPNPVDDGGLVGFSGSASTDDLAVVNWTWSFSEKTTPHTLYGVFVSWAFTEPGTWNVTLAARDAAGNIGNDWVDVIVRDITPPAADAGPDQTVGQRIVVHFLGTGSSDDVSVANYTWTFLEGGISRTLYGAATQYGFPEAGTYDVLLTVRDAAGNSDTDTVRITVLDTIPPTAVAPLDRAVVEGRTVQLLGVNSTDNVGVTSYTWNITRDGAVIATLSGAVVSYRFADPGTYIVVLTVRDAAGNTGSDLMVVTVEAQSLLAQYWWALLLGLGIPIAIGAAFLLRRRS